MTLPFEANLSVQAYVEDLTKAQYGVIGLGIPNSTVAVNVSSTVPVSILGGGETAISSVEYELKLDGTSNGTQTATFATPVGFAEVAAFNVTVTPKRVGTQDIVVTITKVNGVALDNPVEIKGTLSVLSKVVNRGVVVEEFTGTGCGWCPRGWVGMENMHEKFGDAFVGVAIHQYNSSDPMYIAPASYAKLGFTGAPSCMINRATGGIDPYYGTGDDICDDFQAALNMPSMVDVNVTGQYSSDSTFVAAHATVEALIDGGAYTIEFALIGDGLEGGTSAWKQSNYYSQYTSSQLPSDLAPFGSGGSLGQSSVSLVFNDVALSSSYSGGQNQAGTIGMMKTGDVVTRSYELSMPTKAALKKAILFDKVAVIAMVVNADGTIENAAKTYVTAYDELGINDNSVVNTAKAVGFYTIDGRQISQLQHGLNIVKMSDGTTVKIMVK